MVASNKPDPEAAGLLAQCVGPAALLDAQGRILAHNDEWSTLWSASKARESATVGPDDLFGALAARGDEDQPSIQLRLDAADGAPRWFDFTLFRLPDDASRFIAMATDVTARTLLEREVKLARMVIGQIRHVGIVCDRKGAAIFCSEAFEKTFGYRADELLGRKPMDLLSGLHTDHGQCARVRKRMEKGSARCEMLLYDKAGHEIWTTILTRAVLNERGQATNYVLLIEDIGESRKIRSLQRAILDAVAKDKPLAEIGGILCKRIARLAPDVTPSLLRVDAAGCVHPVAALGIPEEFSTLIDGVPIGPTMGCCGAAAWNQKQALSRDISTDPNWAPFKDIPLAAGLRACWSSPIIGKDGRSLGAFAFYFKDRRGPSRWHRKIVNAVLGLCALAIDRFEAQGEIERLAYFDALTGLPNRSRLREKFEAMKMRQGGLDRAAFLFVDIDNFKDVNDTLGHNLGDELLAGVSKLLKSVVGPEDILVRHGGDEFVIVLPGVDADGASAFAEKLRAHLDRPIRLGETLAPVSLSIGVSLYPQDGPDSDTLLTNADFAMYGAKRAGRSTHRRFDPSMRSDVEARVACSRALREALATGGLMLHFQPQVWTASGALRGVEALARWRDPVLGDVSPARFIPIAEEYGLAGAIGEWSLNEAARHLARWRAEGLAVPHVSVNLSPAQLHEGGQLDAIARALDEHRLSPRDLVIEITEGALMTDRLALEQIRAMSAMGVCISLDDFGTGYSNLARLAQLPIDELKIDRSLIARIAEDSDMRAVANIAVQIGKSLRKRVVAEGVETAEQREALRALGCDAAQGYLYARPMPPQNLADWLVGRAEPAENAA
ncbi:MAG: EAL domain-containing protein [Beijerinckiaceae bacterium]